MNEEMLAEFVKKYGTVEDYLGDTDKYHELLGAFVVGWKVASGVAELKLRAQLAAASARANAFRATTTNAEAESNKWFDRATEQKLRADNALQELARVRAWLKENSGHGGGCCYWDSDDDECTCGYSGFFTTPLGIALAAPVTPSPTHPVTES